MSFVEQIEKHGADFTLAAELRNGGELEQDRRGLMFAAFARLRGNRLRSRNEGRRAIALNLKHVLAQLTHRREQWRQRFCANVAPPLEQPPNASIALAALVLRFSVSLCHLSTRGFAHVARILRRETYRIVRKHGCRALSLMNVNQS